MSAGRRHVYVYCIGGPAVAAVLDGLAGLEDGLAPFAVEAAGLAAAASEVPADIYAEGALGERLSDLGWTGEKGVRHERVVETCFVAAGPVIPLRFCTIFEDRARVESLLEGHAERFRAILADLAGKAEWGLRAYVDRDRWAAAAAARAAAEAAGESGTGSGTGAGRAYLERKKAARDARRAGADALAGALGEALLSLAAHAARAKRQPLPEISGGPGGELALKAAFLVPLARREAFEAAAEVERARREADGILLRVTGPWPPYAFVPPLDERAEEGAVR